MTPQLRRIVLFAYLGVQAFYLASLVAMMFTGNISEAIFLAQAGLVLNGLGALLIRPDTTAETAAARNEVAVTSTTTTTTETQPPTP